MNLTWDWKGENIELGSLNKEQKLVSHRNREKNNKQQMSRSPEHWNNSNSANIMSPEA